VPTCSTVITSSKIPRTSSPITVPWLSSPVPKCPIGRSSSPVTIPFLSSPVPKTASPLTLPNKSTSLVLPKSFGAEAIPRNSSPVTLPRLSSPVTVPKMDSWVPNGSPQLCRKTFTTSGTSSPRASPVSLATVPMNTLYSPENTGDVLDLTVCLCWHLVWLTLLTVNICVFPDQWFPAGQCSGQTNCDPNQGNLSVFKINHLFKH
uniref:Uncharacterized protein n=1 Tax=Xiphophorus couchianus TaxID=32473 RepID=A0A3B5MVK9_9TELE